MAAVTQPMSSRSVWRIPAPSHVLWILIALDVLAFWPTFAALAQVWMAKSDYRHGFIVVLVSLAWLWRSHNAIDTAEIKPAPWVLAGMLVVVACWIVAYRANSELMQQLLCPIVVLFAIWAALGWNALRNVVPPIAYLYFAIPVWDHAIPVLQALTTHVAEGVLGFMGVPTQVEGHHVEIPAGRFSIVEGCSGARYFITALAFASLAGALQPVRGRKFIALIAIAVVAALVTNWVRVIIIIYAGHVTDMQHYFVAVEHKSLGYAMFAPLLVAIVAAVRWLGRATPTSARRAPESDAQVRGKSWIASAILLALPVFAWALPTRGQDARPTLHALPVMTGDWHGPLPADPTWAPEYAHAADERRASYSGGGQRVEVYLNVFGVQSPGRELIYHANSVAPAKHWTLIRRYPRGKAVPPSEVVSDASGSRWVVAQAYVVGGHVTEHPALAQIFYGVNAVVRAVPAGTLATASACVPDCDVARQRLEAFWASGTQALVDTIPKKL
jgi:EpsI family protein